MLSHFVEENASERKGPSRDLLIASILIFNTFSWLYILLMLLDATPENLYKIDTLIFFYIFTSISSVTGAFLSRYVKRLKFLCLWIGLGVITSFLPVFISIHEPCLNRTLSSLLGVSFGLGVPSCLAYYGDSTYIEKRGRVSGLILFATNLVVFPLSLAFTYFDSSPLIFVLLALWRFSAFIPIFIFKSELTEIHRSKVNFGKSIANLLKKRRFFLYFIPWIFFLLIDRFCGAILERPLIEAIFGSFSSLIAGYLADFFGRKRIVIIGFVFLGIAYGVMGLAPNVAVARYFHFVIDGAAAGILSVIFILILWADLSEPGLREDAYMLGNILLLPSRILTILLPFYMIFPPINTVFSLASFFLFLAVVPLMYAPETLPEKLIRRRELEKYVEKAKKIREKYEKRREN